MYGDNNMINYKPLIHFFLLISLRDLTGYKVRIRYELGGVHSKNLTYELFLNFYKFIDIFLKM